MMEVEIAARSFHVHGLDAERVSLCCGVVIDTFPPALVCLTFENMAP